MNQNLRAEQLLYTMRKNKGLKVAIVHDHFFKWGGAERVVKTILAVYPDADIFTMFGDTKLVQTNLNKDVKFSFLQKFPFLKSYYRYTYFLWPLAIETLKLDGYDIVISSSSSVAKGVLTSPNTLHISYIHSPMRYAWDMKDIYFKNIYILKKLIIFPLLNYLRMWDVASSKRIDVLILNSQLTKMRVKKYWGIDSKYILNPPVQVLNLGVKKVSDSKYILAISPFEPNKGGELLIESAIEGGFNLKIIGEGSLKKSLEKKSRGHKNIEFLGSVTEEVKNDLILNAKALIFCGVEDYGIAIAEALLLNTPVVAYNRGGASEIVSSGKTGILFETQSTKNVLEAISKLEGMKYVRDIKHINSKEIFKKKFKAIVDSNLGF